MYKTPTPSKRKLAYEAPFASKRVRYARMARRYVPKSVNKYKDSKAKIPETKFADTDLSFTVSPGASATNLVNIAQGTDYNQRIGRKIRLRSVHYKLGVSALASGLNTGANYPLNGSNIVRIALVNDKQNDAAGAPSTGLIWATSGTTDQLAPTRMRNMNYIDRFDVLAEDLVLINAGGPLGALVNKYVKLDLPCLYNVTTGGNTVTNNLFLVVMDMHQSTGGETSCYGEVRVSFFDD